MKNIKQITDELFEFSMQTMQSGDEMGNTDSRGWVLDQLELINRIKEERNNR